MPKIYPYSLISLLLSLLLVGFTQNLDQVQNIFTSPPTHPAIDVAYSPDSSLLALALLDEANSIKILEADSGREVASLVGHTSLVHSVAFSPDGSFLASGSYDKTVKIWRTADFSLLASLEEHTDWVRSVAFSPAGDFLASGSVDKTVGIWRTADFSLLASLEEHTNAVLSVAFSPAGDFLASGSSDDTVKIWRTNDFSLVESLEEHTHYVHSVAFSPAGDFLASGSHDNTVKIWRTNDFFLVTSLEEHTSAVTSVAFSPAGDFLASGSRDNTVKIWHVNDSYSLHKAIAGANGSDYRIPSVAFHPAGTSLAFGNLTKTYPYDEGVVSLLGTPSGQAVFCPSGTCGVTSTNTSVQKTTTQPEFSILFPTANQEVKGQSLALQLQINDVMGVEYSISASGTPLAINYQQQTAPNAEQKVLVNLEVEIVPELQGRNIILEVKAKNSAEESVQYVPVYVVPAIAKATGL